MIENVIKIKEDKMIGNNLFGFHSLKEFFVCLLGTKWSLFNSIPGFFLFLTTFITSYIYESSENVYVLLSLMACDWVTGILKSFKNKTFVSYKIYRIPIYLTSNGLILTLSWWMSKQTIIFSMLPSLIIWSFYSIYFVSILENLGELEWLPKPIIKVLKNKFGFKSLIDRFDKSEGSEDPKN